VPLLYEVADDRDLPGEARAENGRLSWRMRARHRAREVERPASRAADADIAAAVAACRSARDRLIVLLMARAGMRCGEVAGLRRSDVHLLADSRPLGCGTARAHVHVVLGEDNPNGAWPKSRRQRVVLLDFLSVQLAASARMMAFGRSGATAAAADVSGPGACDAATVGPGLPPSA
jgi:integrase/recombinase XerD